MLFKLSDTYAKLSFHIEWDRDRLFTSDEKVFCEEQLQYAKRCSYARNQHYFLWVISCQVRQARKKPTEEWLIRVPKRKVIGLPKWANLAFQWKEFLSQGTVQEHEQVFRIAVSSIGLWAEMIGCIIGTEASDPTEFKPIYFNNCVLYICFNIILVASNKNPQFRGSFLKLFLDYKSKDFRIKLPDFRSMKMNIIFKWTNYIWW